MDDYGKAREAFWDFEKEVETKWVKPKDRVLGFRLLSPPVVAGATPQGYTEDWAVIELDLEKFDLANFVGNAIDLGGNCDLCLLTRMMNPHPRNPPTFKYPLDCLLRFRGKISLNETRNPTLLGGSGEPGIMVIKRGGTTGLTTGRQRAGVILAQHRLW